MKDTRSNDDDLSRRVLRRKKRLCYNEKFMKKNLYRQNLFIKRHRSWDPAMSLKETSSSIRLGRRSKPNSASSIESVIYLGSHKKIPQLIVLNDSSDDEKPQVFKRRLRKTRSNTKSITTLTKKKEKDLKPMTPNLLNNNDPELLHMLSEMHVSVHQLHFQL